MATKKRIVVTGGSGRVGRYVLAQLVQRYDVVNADLQPCAQGPGGTEVPQVEFVQTNVMELDQVRNVTAGADAIVHLAALDYDWNCAPEEYISVNALGTWHVLQAAAENKVPKVVLCSSISACGLSEMRPEWLPQELPVTEEHELRPVQPYSISKILMETMGKAISDGHDMSVICIRPMAVVLEETLAEFVAFIDNPTTHWLYYYVEASDLARAFECAVNNEDIKFGVYFISADDTCRAEPTLDWYKQRLGNNPKINNAVYTKNPRASIFSNEAAKAELGWQPQTDFMQFRKKVLGS